MPIGSTGHSGAVGVNFLMTTYTTQCRHASALSTSNDIREMAMAIIALLRIVCRRVTVDAARRGQN